MFRILRVIMKFVLVAQVLALRESLLPVLSNQNLGTKENKIINGIKVKINEKKYQIFFHTRTPYGEDNTWKWATECSGSIIAEQYILTAAHCVITEDNIFLKPQPVIVPGIIDAYAEENKYLEVGVAMAYVPKQFKWFVNQTGFIGDIAVLKLTKKLNLGRKSLLTKLKLPQTNTKNTYAGLVAVVSGFGARETWFEYDDADSTNQTESYQFWNVTGKLHRMRVRVITKFESRLLQDYCQPQDQIICTVSSYYYDYGGVCNGDSGGPLVYRKTVIGIVSGSAEYCHDYDEYPAHYTRVSTYVGFIRNAVNGIVTSDMRVHTW